MLQKFLFSSYSVQFGQSPDVATHEHAVSMNTCPIDISVHIWIKPSEIHFVIFGVMALRWTAPNAVTPCLGSADNLTSVFANVSQRAIAAKLRREIYMHDTASRSSRNNGCVRVDGAIVGAARANIVAGLWQAVR